jgi:tetratricopeptide (TPR) repeat protein
MGDLFAIGSYFIADGDESAGRNGAGRKDDSADASEQIRPGIVEPLLNFAFNAIKIESANAQIRMSSGQREKRMVMFDLIDQGIVSWLLPLFERHQPERAAFIRSHLGHIENSIPATTRQAMNAPRPTTVKELLEAAQAKNDPLQKDMLYAEAARKAEEAGDFEQAIAITEKLRDKSMGTDVSTVRDSAVIKTSDKGDLDAAYRYAKEIPDPFNRAKSLCRVALKSFEKGDLQRANELIDEAGKTIAKSGPTPDKVFALLEVAAAEAKIDPAGGFESVNTAVTVINQIHSAKPQSSAMDFIRDSTTFEKSLGILARADFERAMRLALAITPGDISALAQLAVCRGALLGPK